MASGTADLQRDFGGAIMTSIFGALLTAGYGKAFSSKISGLPSTEQSQISNNIISELLKSFDSASSIAMQYPQYSSNIISAAKLSFLAGDHWAYLAGILAIIIGGILIYFKFPNKEDEKKLLAKYESEDKSSENN